MEAAKAERAAMAEAAGSSDDEVQAASDDDAPYEVRGLWRSESVGCSALCCRATVKMQATLLPAPGYLPWCGDGNVKCG